MGLWPLLRQRHLDRPGCVDFSTVFEILGNAGFQGWLIVETDVTQLPTALESAIVGRKYLRGLGL